MQLNKFNNKEFDRGRPILIEALWLVVQALFVSTWFPGAKYRIACLRLFGSTIGKGVNIKPRVRIKFPWRLEIGDHSWIGEDVWIDNLAAVCIGNHCCISQGVYLCTGNHDRSSECFDLLTKPIRIGDSVWLGAKSIVGPGVSIGEGAVLGLGSVATTDLKAWWIHQGVPALPVRQRINTEKINKTGEME